MSTAFVVEILKAEPGGRFPTWYLRHDGVLQDVPDLFIDEDFVKTALLSYVEKNGDEGLEGTLIQLSQLDRGLKSCFAKRIPLRDVYNELKPLPGDAPNVVWKLQLTTEAANKAFNVPVAYYGSSTPIGRVWEKASQVRAFISANISTIDDHLKGAQVVRIEFGSDLVLPKSVQRFELLRFYLQSEHSRSTYDRWKRTEAVMSTTPALDALVEAPLPSDPLVVKELMEKPITPGVSKAVEWRF